MFINAHIPHRQLSFTCKCTAAIYMSPRRNYTKKKKTKAMCAVTIGLQTVSSCKVVTLVMQEVSCADSKHTMTINITEKVFIVLRYFHSYGED
jgi:hypothetical protein